MAKKQVIMRVAALGLMGGAGALFAAQAGVLPGFGFDNGQEINVVAAAVDGGTAGAPAALASLRENAAAYRDGATGDSGGGQPLVRPQTAGFGTAVETVPASLDATLPDMAGDDLRPAIFGTSADLPAPHAAAPTEPATDRAEAQAVSPFGLPCGLDVSAEAARGAMIALGVAAPCHPDATITIIHSGLTIAARSDAFGLVNVDLPAMETPAFISVRLDDGSEAEAIVAVPDLVEFERTALVWQGDLGLALHAFEGDAGWMSQGHVHAEAPRDVAALAAGEGFMTVLGQPGTGAAFAAQVYTRPVSDEPSSLSVDAPVTAATCGTSATTSLLRVRAAQRAEVTPLGITYPGCDAVGDILVLQNLQQDRRLAAN